MLPSMHSMVDMSNPFLSSGLVLMLAGGAMYYFKAVLTYILEWVARRFFMEIAEHPESVWISQQSRVIIHNKRTKPVVFGMGRQHADDLFSATPPDLLFQPGEGIHVLRFKGRFILLSKGASTTPTSPPMGTAVPGQQNRNERASFYTLGRTKDTLQEFIRAAMAYCLNKDKDKTIIYTSSGPTSGTWGRALTKPKRLFDSVILDSEVAMDLVADAEEFLRSGDWYRELGVPYRRSYLLHGKPGCGKTSTVTALAGKLGLNVCFLSASAGMHDTQLSGLLQETPEGAIILMEDIDCAFPSREDSEMPQMMGPRGPMRPPRGNPGGVTFSGILNALDGIAAQEGRIIVMTTNHVHNLDPALLRPGRCDRIIEFKLATEHQAKRLFSRFYPKELDLAEKFAKSIPNDTLSMAQLQGLFLRFKQDPLSAFNELGNIIKEAQEKAIKEKKKEQAKAEEEQQQRQQMEMMMRMANATRGGGFPPGSFPPPGAMAGPFPSGPLPDAVITGPDGTPVFTFPAPARSRMPMTPPPYGLPVSAASAEELPPGSRGSAEHSPTPVRRGISMPALGSEKTGGPTPPPPTPPATVSASALERQRPGGSMMPPGFGFGGFPTPPPTQGE